MIIILIDGLSGKDRDNEISIGDASFPPLLTIFSAPNYCDKYQNKAAILRISCDLDGFHAIQYDCVVHPEPEIVASQTDNYILAIICACPYMPTSLRKFVQMAVDLGPDLAQSQNEWISSSPFASRQNSTANTGNESTPTSASVSALNVKKNNTKGDFIPPPDAEIGSNSTVYSNATTRPESKGASRRTSRHEAFEAARLALSRIEMHPKIMPFASVCTYIYETFNTDCLNCLFLLIYFISDYSICRWFHHRSFLLRYKMKKRK